MLTMLGSPKRCCDGVTRREALRAGGLALLGAGFQLPQRLALAAEEPTAGQRGGPGRPRASSCSTCWAARPRRTWWI